ncbi:MAG: ribosome maturation factor RimM [Dysgonamonadaceae bacterium]
MIRRDEVFSIGRFLKPHGVKGEMAMSILNDVFSHGEYPFLVCDMDNILVPFFVKSMRYKGSQTALIQFEDIHNETQAHRFDGVEVYLHRSLFDGNEMQKDEYSWNFFVGFTVIDERYGQLGVIQDVDDDTANVLFIIESAEGEEILIPAAEELITGYDPDHLILQTELPEGLLDEL